jgi:hypothetical protein
MTATFFISPSPNSVSSTIGYYGVHGNAASLKEFFNKAVRILLKWLNRRSQRHSYTWPGYTEVLERFHVARPRIVGRPKTRQATLKT